jgi:osmotically-inducible protein OsmY
VSPRGPRGWVRSDERILDELCERIVRAGVDASELEVAVEDHEVRLHGVLTTARDRRLVMDLAERVLGVRAVDAEIVVREGSDEVEEEVEPTWH